jgi:hypothetical protein
MTNRRVETIDLKTKQRFLYLVVGLSPEIIGGGGEFSSRQREQRKAEIDQEWSALETQIGRKVSEDEAWDFRDDPEVKETTRKKNKILQGHKTITPQRHKNP